MTLGYIISESATTVAEDLLVNKSGRRATAKGRLQTAEEKNRNGRIYTKAELFPQLKCPRTKELLEAGYMRAESGHPLSSSLVRQQTIDPTNTCAIFTKFWTEGDDVYGEFMGTNNALGEAFNQDLLDGYKPAWSLRALGSIETTKRGAEVHNLKLITYDHVIYPSHPGAYTTGLVSESANITDSGIILPKNTLKEINESTISKSMDATAQSILPVTNDSVISYIKSESASFKMIKESFDLLFDSITLTEDGSAVQMVNNNGDVMVINLEKYIQNEIMDYCSGGR